MAGFGSNPTQVTENQMGFAPQLQPYAEALLGQAFALSDTSANPYMQYQGERQAQFSPLQQQSFENAALMATAPQLEQGTALAGQAGLMGLGLMGSYGANTYKPGSFTDVGVPQNYMSPYIQNVIKVQQDDAKRQAAIAAQGQQAQAARAGAFGGARDIINRNEANRALQTQLAGITATGMQNAFTNAQQQFNTEQQQQQQAQQLGEQSRQFGANLGLQGLQSAMQGAQTIGSLGQNQFGQAMDINRLQNQYGTAQQQQMQNILNQQYQDYLNYQNYPYKQLGFFSDILRGVPLTQTGTTMYQAPPSATSQLVGLGTAALGASKLGLFKKGGEVKAKRPAGLAELAIHNMG